MPRLSTLSLEELLNHENDWWDRQDEENHAWLNEGIRLFQNLSKLDRDEGRYGVTLAYLHLKLGEDLKLRKHSYERAMKSFERVLRLDRTNALASYRLGFIHFYEESWALSAHHFQQSIMLKPTKKDNCLSDEQRIKAYHFILKATQNIMKSTIHEVSQIPGETLNVFGEIKLLVEEMKEGLLLEEEKPYQMVVNGVEVSNLTERGYRELSDPDKNDDILIYDFQGEENTTVSWLGKSVTIFSSRVSLLEYLMRHPEGMTKEDYINGISRFSKNPASAFTQHIRRLRVQLKHLDPTHPFIETIEGGYRSNSPIEYRIFKHTNNVTSDLLFD